MERTYKRTKSSTVQLTSLLDLLFVMIFVSLIQQKPIPEKKPAVAKVVETARPTATPKPVITKFSIQATFNFYASSQNPHLPEGSYLMHGSYDQNSGQLRLGGISWIQRPENYDMVPLSGIIDSNQQVFEGRIEFQGCRKFILKRKSQTTGSSPISGEWIGEYDCSQGETGLTLTVH